MAVEAGKMERSRCANRVLSTQPLTREINNFTRAAPGQGETCATVAIVVNYGAAIAQAVPFEAYA